MEIVNAVLTVGAGGELQPFHTQHDVLQRVGIEAQFGVLHLGIDDHQIALRHGQQIVSHTELTHAAHHIKQFDAVVGVGQAVPVGAIGRRGGIEQPRRGIIVRLTGRTLGGSNVFRGKVVSLVAHGVTPVQTARYGCQFGINIQLPFS